MQDLVDDSYDSELSRPPGTVAPLKENSMVTEIDGGPTEKP
jgi:hypothetical protein